MSRTLPLVTLLLLALPAQAQERPSSDGRSYVNVLYGVTAADKARDPTADRARGPCLIIGSQRLGRIGFEGILFSDKFDTPGSGVRDQNRLGLGLDAVYAFGDRQKFTPFALAGGGLARNEASFSGGRGRFTESSFYAEAGIGVVTGAGAPVNLRGDVRALYDAVGDGVVEIRASIGFEVSLRKRRPPPLKEKPVQVVAPAAGVDTDKDGVRDESDVCPGTAAGTPVDDSGCDRVGEEIPAAVPAPAEPAELLVPAPVAPAAAPDLTPEPAPAPDMPAAAPAADITPAPTTPATDTDTDQDGVDDSMDRCASTPRTHSVNDKGCPLPRKPAEPAPAPASGTDSESAPSP